MTIHKSEDYKISVVNYYLNNDVSQIEVCNIFNCSPRSLMRWVEQYENSNEIKRNNRTPISYKITKEQVNFIINELKKNKTITMDNLVTKTKEKFNNFDITPRHLSRIIKDNNITLKITKLRHEPISRFGKDININEMIKNFYKEIKKYKLDDIICIDETSIKALQNRNHCYNDIGKRCVIKTKSQDVFKKYTSIFAVSSNGVVGWNLYEKSGITTERLIEFLETYITTKFKNKLIILDNASSHKNEKIKNLIDKHNKVLYSVPYQHYTNSIENFFSMLKSYLQKLDGLKYEIIKKNIEIAIKNISKQKYENIFKGSYERKEIYIKESKTRAKPLKNYL